MNYQFLPDVYGVPAQCIKGILDSGQEVFIPKDNANTDYQEYLEWVAEGNTPEAAE